MSSINEANNTEIPSQNTGGNLNDGKNSNSKKKEQAPKETFYNLCHSLLRFINRRIVKKYVLPNEAQLPKERRGLDLRANNDWKYYLNKDVTEDEKIKDVFKDDKFLGSLQKMTNSLNAINILYSFSKLKISCILGSNNSRIFPTENLLKVIGVFIFFLRISASLLICFFKVIKVLIKGDLISHLLFSILISTKVFKKVERKV